MQAKGSAWITVPELSCVPCLGCFVASSVKVSHSAGLCSQLVSNKGELLNLCAQDHRWYNELGARLFLVGRVTFSVVVMFL